MNTIAELQDASRNLANKLRLGLDIEACQEMVDFLPMLLTGVSNSLSSSQMLQLQKIIGNMLICQENQDWIGLADYLEYELIEWLGTVKPVGL